MSQFQEHPAAVFLRRIAAADGRTVELRRVLTQRAIFAEISATALLEPSLALLLEKCCRGAAEGCDAPMAKVLESRQGQMLIRAEFGLDPDVIGTVRVDEDTGNPAGECFANGTPVCVRDVRRQPGYHLPPIYGRYGVVSTANLPIVGISGRYGVLEIDCMDERDFDALDVSFLAGIAGTIADAVERVRRQTAMQAAYDAREHLLKEHHHRVRNSYQIILGQLQRHAMQATTENSRRRFEDVERRVFAVASLYDYLTGAGLAEDRIEFCNYLRDLCGRVRDFYGLPDREIELACGCPEISLEYDAGTCTAFGAVVNELVANAVEHAFDGTSGHIHVGLAAKTANEPVLTVSDNGAGFGETPPDGIGLSVVERLVSGAGGSITRVPSEGGTTWRIALPPGRSRSEPRQ